MDDAGFKKIEFNKNPKIVNPNVKSSTSTNPAQDFSTNMKPKARFSNIFGKRGLSVIGVVVIVFILIVSFASWRALAIYKNSQGLYTQAKKAADAAKSQNVVLAREELVKTKDEAGKLRKELGTIGFMRFIPFLGVYISDADHLIGAGIHGINAAIITSDSLIPYADLLGLKGQGSFTGGSAEDRIRTAVKSLGKVVPKIDDIEVEIVAAKREIDHVNPNRYPNFGPFKKIRNQISTARTLVDEGALAVEQGKPLIKVLPELLGAEKSKKYLVLFQNDKELRPTGGFLTYYSIFRIEQGVIHIDSSNDIYVLDDSIRSHPKADPIILKYLPKVPTQNIRDINLSPDFIESMEDFMEYYNKSSLKTDIDGIIAIDTQFMVHLIEILGEVQAAGQTFTAKNDPQCACPQVVYQLELTTTKPVNYVKTNRKGIVGDLLYATMQKSLQSSPKLYWGPLFQAAIKDATEKHIIFSLEDKDAQKGIDALNWAGRIKPFDGDYLSVNDANFGGAKSNMYIKNSMKIEYKVDSEGAITKTVSLEYRNPQKHSDCNLESGGLCLNAVLRDFQRVYVPEGSTLISSRGSQVKVETKKDLGKTYFESFFTVSPLGKASMIYTYKLPFKVTDGKLPVLIQKQPGVEFVATEIFVSGKKVAEFDLREDKVLNLTI